MPVISVAGIRVVLAMSPPRVSSRRHGDTGRDPDVTPRGFSSAEPRVTRRASPRRRARRPRSRNVAAARPSAVDDDHLVLVAVGGKPVSNFALTTASRPPWRATVAGTWKAGLVMTFSTTPGRQVAAQADLRDLVGEVLDRPEPPGLQQDAVDVRHVHAGDRRRSRPWPGRPCTACRCRMGHDERRAIRRWRRCRSG